MKGRVVAAALLAALVLPPAALAHGRSAIIALDYRLTLSPTTLGLTGVHVRILDGDRDFEVSVSRGVDLLVRGELDEPMLRIDSRGVWVNASSPTATSDKLISADRHGWVRVSGGASIVWHDHRLLPPPTSTVGPDGDFSIPIDLDGRATAISGSFYRVARPSGWPWLLAGLAVAGAILLAARQRGMRGRLVIGLGIASGLSALTAVTTFAAEDSPSGGGGWLEIVTALVVALALGTVIARLYGRARVHAAGVIGAVGAAVAASALSVFWHGVVISLLPGTLARLACFIGIECGVAAVALSFLRDFDEPLRPAWPQARVAAVARRPGAAGPRGPAVRGVAPRPASRRRKP